MPRDWPHPLDPDPTRTVRRWQFVERIVLIVLLIVALFTVTLVDAERRKRTPKRVQGGAVQLSGRSTVAFRSCAEARAAGAAPVRRGSAGYSKRLDRDGDGVGCE